MIQTKQHIFKTCIHSHSLVFVVDFFSPLDSTILQIVEKSTKTKNAYKNPSKAKKTVASVLREMKYNKQQHQQKTKNKNDTPHFTALVGKSSEWSATNDY